MAPVWPASAAVVVPAAGAVGVDSGSPGRRAAARGCTWRRCGRLRRRSCTQRRASSRFGRVQQFGEQQPEVVLGVGVAGFGGGRVPSGGPRRCSGGSSSSASSSPRLYLASVWPASAAVVYPAAGLVDVRAGPPGRRAAARGCTWRRCGRLRRLGVRHSGRRWCWPAGRRRHRWRRRRWSWREPALGPRTQGGPGGGPGFGRRRRRRGSRKGDSHGCRQRRS